MTPSFAKGIVGACFALGAVDLAVIDLRIAPALYALSPEDSAPSAPPKSPPDVGAVMITRADLTRVPAANEGGSAVTPLDVIHEEYTVLFATDAAHLLRSPTSRSVARKLT